MLIYPSFGGATTHPIKCDASAAAVARALRALSTIIDVDVTRSGPTNEKGFTWTVTFFRVVGEIGGDLPSLIPLFESLHGEGYAAGS